MSVSFIPFQEEADDLVDFLTSDTWPYHGTENPTAEQILISYRNGAYNSDDTKTVWITDNETKRKIGLIRLMDLADPGVVFDLRIHREFRGQGVGKTALEWITAHIFSEYPGVNRIEAHTRVDNAAMRRVLSQSLFVLEAYHRKSWPQSGALHDCVTYAVIKEDWLKNAKTPIPWDTGE